MRLKGLKLSGFKSFVDPTHIPLSTNLQGVVGPNGCGKSNVIDAVRWVMGESSARQLRGESMSDVIFSGSSSRKPVSTATVELLFDNADGQIGGEYAEYREISVKRQLSHDGSGSYYLNGSKCRKRDITDIFLGTGLGPRSYSIIEQGMISQLVEAKPEELRTHLEEAAGISKYRERRRETGNRMRRTQENLDRLEDLRDEVGKQLAHLARQAKQADRYQRLKAQRRGVEQALLGAEIQNLKTRQSGDAEKLAKAQTALEAAKAALTESVAELETLRERDREEATAVDQAQAAFYETGSQLARLEQQLNTLRDRAQRLDSEAQRARDECERIDSALNMDRTQVESLNEKLQTLSPELAAAEQAHELLRGELDVAETKRREAQSAFDQQRDERNQSLQRAEVTQLKLAEREREIDRVSRELEDSAKACDDEIVKPLEARLAEHEKTYERRKSEADGAAAKVEAARESLAEQRETTERARQQLDEKRALAVDLQARERSLAGLRDAAVKRQRSDEDGHWRDANRLDAAPILADRIKIDSDWSQAVEAVLGSLLLAPVTEIDVSTLDVPPISTLVHSTKPASAPPAESLGAKIAGHVGVARYLSHLHCADDFIAARSLAAKGAIAITRDATIVGAGWWQRLDDDASVSGLVDKLAELVEVRDRLPAANAVAEQAANALQLARQAVQSSEDQLEQLRQQAQAAVHALSEAQARLSATRQSLEQAITRRDQARARHEKLTADRSELTTTVGELRRTIEQTTNALADQSEALAQAERRRRDSEQAVDDKRQQLQTTLQSQSATKVALETAKASLHSAQQAIERGQQQRSALESQLQRIANERQAANAPQGDLQGQLDQLTRQRVAREQALSATRDAQAKTRNAIGECERRRHDLDQAVSHAQDALAVAREATTRSDTLIEERQQTLEKLQATAGEVEPVDQTLAGNQSALQQQLEKLERSMARLEPVNLAAISEHAEQSERKAYLDAQHQDLTAALDTLQSAIRKIDKQTRSLFEDTFERVNARLKTLYPQLMGGGHAYLELTDDDLLTAGVVIFARPPGKRVSNIQLLSGGEKALTAVALVFSIFELNPAPFCLLDEVDAPLDDANVGRFSDLVREMSEQVQFVFVTHNKITMAMAHQLLGVTMREAGVSRIVTVDLNEAVEMSSD